MPVQQISPSELAAELPGGDVYLLDVREPWECDTAFIDGAAPVPMANVANALDRIRSDSTGKKLVVMCRSGGRSMSVAMFLNQSGFGDVFNLDGGILAWSEQVDPTLPQY